MASKIRISSWLVVAVAISMLTIAFPAAIATHNSIGANVVLVQPTEDPDNPDIPPDHELRVTYHNFEAGTLEEDDRDLPEDVRDLLVDEEDEDAFEPTIPEPREMPLDQTGERYTDCITAEEAGDAYAPWDNEDQCYVGYLDHQRLTFLYLSLFLTWQPNDSDYWLNPHPNDGHCQGDSPEEVTGFDPADETIASVDRRTSAFLEGGDCDGSGHGQGLPGDVMIDVNLLESPFQDDATPDLSQQDVGSGTQALPQLSTPYVFLFGEPHPEADEPLEGEDFEWEGFSADEPPFTGGVDEGASPLFDLEGACGDRTDQCMLLTIGDLQEYDRHDRPGAGDEGQAAFCEFAPQFQTINPDERDAGICGVTGSPMNQFIPIYEGGGYGTGETTYLNMLPGWYRGIISITTGPTTHGGATTNPATATPGLTGSTPIQYMYAVNPKVPAADDPLWCVTPNFLADGESNVDLGGLNDPGFYGTYIADAIDVDIFHDNPLVDEVQQNPQALDDLYADKNAIQEEFELDDAPDPIAVSQNPIGFVGGIVFDAYSDAVPGEADYLESSPEKPWNTFGETQHSWETDAPDPGVRCNAQGAVVVEDDPNSLKGGIVFDTSISQQTVTLKDPTLVDDDGPLSEEDTQSDGWQTDAYWFSGDILGIVDSNENERFDACFLPDGQINPDEDQCVWQPYWDAYNPSCTTFFGASCFEQLLDDGYALNATHNTDESSLIDAEDEEITQDNYGVGMYFVLELTGPFATKDPGIPGQNTAELRTNVIGAEDDPDTTHCVLGTNLGFADEGRDMGQAISPSADRLANNFDHWPGFDVDLNQPDEDILQDLTEFVCGFSGNVDGEHVFIGDAFSTQNSRASFSSGIDWVKLAPTPDEGSLVNDENDRLCVGAFWNVLNHPDVDQSADSASLALDGSHHFGECLSLAGGTADEWLDRSGAYENGVPPS